MCVDVWIRWLDQTMVAIFLPLVHIARSSVVVYTSATNLLQRLRPICVISHPPIVGPPSPVPSQAGRLRPDSDPLALLFLLQSGFFQAISSCAIRFRANYALLVFGNVTVG
ncbi:hypothetical protein BDN70DRAFT_258519 [Pholiota conissans]|uniref:Uncharacterized protein n=1 Tax=Pholiota conissans TaxID=109636 RepID=A0A9P5YUC8_9AGAR|nr:hypothetical protein BDN70DRAFT_258519 [Pholiota conissans]